MSIPNHDSASTITIFRIRKIDVNYLPIELLSSILALVVFSSERVNFQFRLSMVCRYWRQIIFENPIFWSTISFDWRGKDRTEYMEQFVHNSGLMELAVLGPDVDDSKNDSPAQTHFHSFFGREYKRIKALSLGDFDHRLQGFPNTVFENLRALSMTTKSFPRDKLVGARNLQVFQLTTYYQLPNIIPHLPLHLKKISLTLSSDKGVLQIFTTFKTLEYLSLFFTKKCEYYEITHRDRLSRQSLLNLKTFKSNDHAGLTMDILHAPALQHIEITAASRCEIKDDYSLLDSIDLSIFTHLFVGFVLNTDMDSDNIISGCIWGSVGPSTITCVTNKPSFLKCCQCGGPKTTWPSSWSIFPQLAGPAGHVERLVHLHTLGTYAVHDCYLRLTCKLVEKMPMLDTFVLCLPGKPYPRLRFASMPEYLYFDTPTLFHEIAHYSLNLRNLTIRAGWAEGEDIITLSECFNLEYWTSRSCPLLESITYYVETSELDSDVSWELWVKFLNGRKIIGLPLKHLQLIGYPDPSDGVLSNLEGLSDTEITVPRGQYESLFEFDLVTDHGWEGRDEEYRLVPSYGF